MLGVAQREGVQSQTGESHRQRGSLDGPDRERERETSLELEKRGKAKLGYHMGLETKQRSGQE